VVISVFLLLLAATYTLISQGQPDAFTTPTSGTHAVYFAVTVFATVGLDDISPVSQAARIVVIFQMIADQLLLGFVLRAFLDAMARGRARQRQTPTPTIRMEQSG
jgi:Ion channel